MKTFVVLLSKSILHHGLLSLLRSVLAVHLPSRIESVQLQHHRNVRMNALHVLYLLLKNDYPTHLMTELLFLMFLVFASAMIGLVLQSRHARDLSLIVTSDLGCLPMPQLTVSRKMLLTIVQLPRSHLVRLRILALLL